MPDTYIQDVATLRAGIHNADRDWFPADVKTVQRVLDAAQDHASVSSQAAVNAVALKDMQAKLAQVVQGKAEAEAKLAQANKDNGTLRAAVTKLEGELAAVKKAVAEPADVKTADLPVEAKK